MPNDAISHTETFLKLFLIKNINVMSLLLYLEPDKKVGIK